jgi:hypothetical protein
VAAVHKSSQPKSGSSAATSASRSFAPDVRAWNDRPAITPAASAPYPAIPAATRRDPTSYVRAFAVELFTRDYRASTRAQLLAWAQYEDAPLHSSDYPEPDWTKVLADSLTDLTWDEATATPVPADGPWLALRSEQARDTVIDVRISLDPHWEQRIANGYQPPDPLATERDVSLTVTRHTTVGGRHTTVGGKRTVTRFAVSLDLQLGTSVRGGGYGVAATNNYVTAEVG